MLGDALAVLSLAALAAFILWEGWQRRASASKPLDRSYLERGFVPGAAGYEQALFVAAGVVAAAGVMLFASPPHPPFAGRGALFGSALYGLVGPMGIPTLTLCAAVALLALGLLRRRRRRAAARESS